MPPSGRSASAVISPVVIVLQFTSGAFFVYTELPTWTQRVAELFPLKWMAQGMRSVFLPESFEAREVSGSWQGGATALVLATWTLMGLISCLRTLRWRRRDDRLRQALSPVATRSVRGAHGKRRSSTLG